MRKRIFLDLDGVVADFVGGAFKAFGKSIPLDSQLEYSIEKWFGVTTAEFWLKIDSFGEEFWSELEPYEWTQELFRMLNKSGDLFILSAPSRNPVSSSGKVKWVQRHLPKLRGKIILTSHKYLLAGPNRYLIDDSELKINGFNSFGGNGILFPQPWNGNIGMDRMEFVRNSLISLDKRRELSFGLSGD